MDIRPQKETRPGPLPNKTMRREITSHVTVFCVMVVVVAAARPKDPFDVFMVLQNVRTFNHSHQSLFRHSVFFLAIITNMSDPPSSISPTNVLPVFTEEEQTLIAAVRANIGPRVSCTLEDMDCLRFLRARKCDVTLASTMVQNW